MADGPVIAKAHERALAAGVSLHDVLTLVKKFRQTNDTTAIVLKALKDVFYS
jgi:tryptophan synthase alpha chain